LWVAFAVGFGALERADGLLVRLRRRRSTAETVALVEPSATDEVEA